MSVIWCIALLLAICAGIYVYKTFRHKHSKCTAEDFNKRLFKFLETVDDSYISAFQNRQLGKFRLYAEESVILFLQQQVLYNNTRMWGSADLRTRKWTIISKSPKEVIVRKHIQFKVMTVGKLTVNISEPATEYWRIVIDKSNMKVGDIEC